MTNSHFQLNGIQQIGIGVSDLEVAWKWYRKAFGMDVPVFQDKAEAVLMKKYTGDQVHSRHAVLAMNMQGGGGFEIWQFTSRTPSSQPLKIRFGDLGIFAAKIRTKNISEALVWLKAAGAKILTPPSLQPDGKARFFVEDPFQNVFEIRECDSWFSENSHPLGGVLGVCIGVSDLEKAKKLYSEVLGFDQVKFEESNEIEDWSGKKIQVKRALLSMKGNNPGAFGALLCQAQIELVQVLEQAPQKLFQDRYWGDLGFIHCCLDVNGMDELKTKAQSKGHTFTVDSQDSFDMGKAAGRFCYLEDPDGTLIEMVETHKVPILEKLNWFLDLRKRNHKKNLPRLMVKMMALNRVKD
jgi:catechol 2,3-dioxygenase-like lactoylglutathione lyase family enzyme